jgi:cytochrome c oxidase subunit 2
MTPVRLWQSALAPAGPQAAHIADLSWFLIIITTAVSVLVLGMLAWSLRRGRRRHREGGATNHPGTERALTRAVSAAIGVTVVLLFAILLSSIWTGRLIASLGSAEAVTVSIDGHQFWWEVHYEDVLPSRRVSTANELHIPVGRPVVLKLTSRDVIHSFWVPMLHGKRDLVPGYSTALWIQADRAGTFQGQCAEFCGRQHAHMAFTVVAQRPDEFNRWLDSRRAAAVDPIDERARRGRDLFLTGRCSACHTVAGTGANGLVGPDLTHIASRPTIGAGTLPNTRESLARWIANPQLHKPGNQMPATPLSPEDLDALVAYLEGLK